MMTSYNSILDNFFISKYEVLEDALPSKELTQQRQRQKEKGMHPINLPKN